MNNTQMTKGTMGVNSRKLRSHQIGKTNSNDNDGNLTKQQTAAQTKQKNAPRL